MEKPYILHMFTPEKNISPFDATMAADAGWETLLSYTQLDVREITAMVQDAIFCRSPGAVRRSGIFIGGRDVKTAMDMLDITRNSMTPPFEVSVLADPSGAFTTAAAMVALVERELMASHGAGFMDREVAVLGGTGPVGQIAAILVSQAGGKVTLVGRQLDKTQVIADTCNATYRMGKYPLVGMADEGKDGLLKIAEVVFATAAAGVEVMSAAQIASATRLKAAADVNAVPPAGIAGLNALANGEPVHGSTSGAIGFGSLAVGNIKSQTQHRLLEMMRSRKSKEDRPVFLHYEQAFQIARHLVAG